MNHLQDDNGNFEKKHSNKTTFFSGVLIGIVAIIILNTAFNSIRMVYAKYNVVDLSPEKKLNEIYKLLDEHFVDTYDKKELEESMYSGLVRGIGDPYTSYMDKKTLERFLQQTEGTYAGIGVVVTNDITDNTIKVITPYEDCPGAKAGVLPGDKFIAVNGFEVTGDQLDAAVEMMKGQPGTSVKITVYRENENKVFDVQVVREKIIIPTVSHKMLDNGIGYIRITNFERVTYNQFVTAYNDLNGMRLKGLVIDVRNNPGGLLDVVAKITDVLIPEGIIVYTEDKQGKQEVIQSDARKVEVPLAILVNGNSASASEVLSGAIKDTNTGVLVGSKTYGKGLVQNLYPLSDGSALKVTIAKYYTPSGVCINGDGIIPDYVVEMSDELSVQISSLTMEEDVQLQKAVEVLQAKIK